MTLGTLLSQCAKDQGDRAVIVWKSETLTYRELDERSSRIASGLQRAGVQPGQVVALFIPNMPHFLLAYFAIQKSGAVALPVNLLLKDPEIDYILRDAKAVHAIAVEPFLSVLHSLQPQLPDLTRLIAIGTSASKDSLSFSKLETADVIPLPPPDADSLSTLLYTSGTTGFPKGAMLSHRNLRHQGDIMKTACGFTQEDRLLLALPLFHIAALGLILQSALAARATLVLMESFEPVQVLRTLHEERITCFIGVPTMYISLLEEWRKSAHPPLQDLRLCIGGAAPVPIDLAKRFEATFGLPIVEAYGLTEGSGAVCVNPWQGPIKIGSVGRPVAGNDVKIVDDDDQEVAIGIPGEIVVRGPNVMQGYLNHPKASAETLKEGWLHTGDVGIRDEDGYITIVDRKKDLIIVGGENGACPIDR